MNKFVYKNFETGLYFKYLSMIDVKLENASIYDDLTFILSDKYERIPYTLEMQRYVRKKKLWFIKNAQCFGYCAFFLL